MPESKQARLEALAGEKDDVYELQASQWRNRGGAAAQPQTARTSGSASARSTEGIVGDGEGDVEKKGWWRFRQSEVHGHGIGHAV